MADPEQHIPLSTDGPELPTVDLLTGRGFITGKSGSGKSNTASVIVEELLDRGFACMIVDTEGEYYGLKEKYQVLHVGADEECDLQIGPEHAEKLAELALQQNVPIILDVSGYIETEKAQEIINATAHHIFAQEKKQKKPFLLLVEEVHEYIPEGPSLTDCGRMLIKIGKRGRKRGLGLCGISQRPADVKKDFITQCDWLVWHRLTWENDTKVVRRIMGSDYVGTVQDLDDGECILMADFLEHSPTNVRVRRKHTFDAGATPDLDGIERPQLKSVSRNIVEELEEITEQRRQREDRIGRLRKRIEELKKKNDKLRERLTRAEDLSNLAKQFTEALASQDKTSENVRATVEEIREKKNEKIRELRSERKELRERYEEALERIEDLREKSETAERLRHLEQHMDDAQEAVVRLADALGVSAGDEEKLRKRVRKQKERIAELEQQLQEERPTVEEDKFLEDETVQDEIQSAMEEASSPRYVKGVIATLLQAEEPVTYEDIANGLGLQTTSHIGTAVNALADRNVVLKSKDGRRTTVKFNLEGLQKIRDHARSRERAEELLGGM